MSDFDDKSVGLKEARLLSSLSKENQSKIMKIAETKKFRQNLMVSEENKFASSIFILLKGTASIIQKRKTMTEVKPVTVLFEAETLMSQMLPFGVFAETECEFMVINRDAISALMKKDHELQKEIVQNLLAVMVKKLDWSHDNIFKSKKQNIGYRDLIAEKMALLDQLSKEQQQKAEDAAEESSEEEEETPEVERVEYGGSERREFERGDIYDESTFLALDNVDDIVVLENVSMGGFKADNPVDVLIVANEMLSGKIILSSDIPPVDFTAIVRWNTSRNFGCEFIKITPQSRGLIKRYIDKAKESSDE